MYTTVGITREQNTELKASLKAQFPKSEGWDISVKTHRGNVNIVVNAAPIQFEYINNQWIQGPTDLLIGYDKEGVKRAFFLEQYEVDFLKKIFAIINKGRFYKGIHQGVEIDMDKWLADLTIKC